jgi:hypothetical protein
VLHDSSLSDLRPTPFGDHPPVARAGRWWLFAAVAKRDHDGRDTGHGEELEAAGLGDPIDYPGGGKGRRGEKKAERN